MTTIQSTSIYGLVDPRTQELRYVGKTVAPIAQRLKQHVNDALRGKVDIWRFRWIRALSALGLKPEIFEIESVAGDAWEEAEQFWIAYYRFIGADLCNATAGGDGLHSFRHSEETKRKQSLARAEVLSRPGMRDKYKAALKAAYAKEGVRANLRTALAASWTPERREANLKFMRALSSTPEHRERASRLHKGKSLSAETKDLLRAARLGSRASPETRAAMSAAQVGRKHGPETIEKMRRSAVIREARKRAIREGDGNRTDLHRV